MHPQVVDGDDDDGQCSASEGSTVDGLSNGEPAELVPDVEVIKEPHDCFTPGKFSNIHLTVASNHIIGK